MKYKMTNAILPQLRVVDSGGNLPFPASGSPSARIRLPPHWRTGLIHERTQKNDECKIAFVIFWYSRRESNPQLTLRRGLLYPFNYGSVLFCLYRRFLLYYIIGVKSNFLSHFSSFYWNISRQTLCGRILLSYNRQYQPRIIRPPISQVRIICLWRRTSNLKRLLLKETKKESFRG